MGYSDSPGVPLNRYPRRKSYTMLNSFIIVLREGFESFLLVAVILAYLHKSGQRWLKPSVYAAIILALAASGGLAYLLNTGVEDRKSTRLNSSHGYISYAVFCL